MTDSLRCSYDFKTRNIGAGSYGEVSIVEKNGDKFAYKKIKKDKSLKKSYFYNPIELDIEFRLQSPYLIKGEEVTLPKECTPEEVGLVTEYIDGNLGKDVASMPFSQRKRIMFDLVLGLKCLHDNDYLHLDIKIENVMYRKGPQPRGVLIDYGLSSYTPYGVSEGLHTDQGRLSFEYNSPQGTPDKDEYYYYNDKTDVWSLGLTFLDMIADGNFTYLTEDIMENLDVNKSQGKISKSFKELSKYQTYYFADSKIDELLDDFGFKYGPADIDNKDLLKDLLKNMLKVNDKLRYNINQVANHPYFKEFTFRSEKSCFVKQPKLIEPLEHIKVNQVEGVREIIKYCKENLADRSAYILFMAIDIYMRFLHNIHKYHNIENEILEPIKNELTIVCPLIANKYFYWGESSIDPFIEEVEKYINTENLIYKIIDGRIRDERYFNHCKNTNEVKFVYNYFFVKDNGKNITDFLKYDGEGFMNAHRIRGTDEDTFNMDINQL
jgi:serine/threonine protein kinase